MKSIVVASMAALLFLSANQSRARDVYIDLRLVQQNVNVGGEVSVEVNIDQVSDLKGIDILISFDKLKLEYKSIKKGDLISSFSEDIAPKPEVANSNGKIEYAAVLETPGPGINSPGGTVLILNFTAKSPGDTWIQLLPNDMPLGDSMANAIPSNVDTTRCPIKIGQIFSLKRVFNYPNPAPDPSGNTVIRCESLALLEGLEAKIYDISAELVKEIKYEDFDASKAPVYEYKWDCKNEVGKDVANGTYILWVKAKLGSEEKNEIWKIAILR